MRNNIVGYVLVPLITLIVGYFVPRAIQPVALIKHDREKVTLRDDNFKSCELRGVVAFEDGRRETSYLCDKKVIFMVTKPVSYYTELGLNHQFKETSK